MSHFKGKLIVLSGAALGLGRELAHQLSGQGARLLLIDIDGTSLKKLEAELGRDKSDLFTLKADLTDPSFIEVCKGLPDSWRSPDIIIANAGLGGLNPAYDFSMELNRQTFEVNYFGMLNLFAPFLTNMIQRRSGHLVGVASLAGLRGLPNATSYCASKAAQISALESFRNDLRPFGIKVTSVVPGFLHSRMTAHREFPMPFRMSLSNAAKKTLSSIEKGCSTTYFPWPMAILAHLNRLLPAPIYDAISRIKLASTDKKPQLFG